MKSAYQRNSLLLTASAFLLAGCLGGGGNSGGGDDTRNGQITPTGISGLTYQTASQRAKTGNRGQYQYYAGERLTLWVGDLQIATDVPVEPVVTPLEFFPNTRSLLDIPGTDPEGLQSHRVTEQQLIQTSDGLVNVTRFLLALNWRLRISDGSGIEIRDRVIQQINATLPTLSGPIDFSVPTGQFALEEEANLSPANQLLAEICFYPEDNELCEDPPTDAMIDSAPSLPEDPADIIPPDERDPEFDYREELESKRDRILNAIRSLDNIEIDTVEDYLTRELDIISTDLSIQYYLNDFVADYSAADTSIKTVVVKKIGGKPSLNSIEAFSTREDDVAVHSFGWQSASVDYFVAGDPGGEAEILVNFRPADTYRWVKKQLRVIVR